MPCEGFESFLIQRLHAYSYREDVKLPHLPWSPTQMGLGPFCPTLQIGIHIFEPCSFLNATGAKFFTVSTSTSTDCTVFRQNVAGGCVCVKGLQCGSTLALRTRDPPISRWNFPQTWWRAAPWPAPAPAAPSSSPASPAPRCSASSQPRGFTYGYFSGQNTKN